MWFQDFQDWTAKQNDLSNSEFLCRSDASHQVSAQSNLRFGRKCLLKNLKMVTMATILILEQNNFSNSESLCRLDASHQVLAQSDLRFGRCHLKNFKITAMAAKPGYQNGTILPILSLCVTVIPPIKFWLNPTYSLGGDVV